MGKLKGNARKQIQQVIGEVFAAKTGDDIYRLRDGILIETEEGDVVIKVILKKDEIEFSMDDVLDTYTAAGQELPDEVEDEELPDEDNPEEDFDPVDEAAGMEFEG